MVMTYWMWKYYFWLALLTVMMIIVFFIAFCMFVAPFIIVYLIRTSFPPFTDECADLVNFTIAERELMHKKAELKQHGNKDFRRTNASASASDTETRSGSNTARRGSLSYDRAYVTGSSATAPLSSFARGH